jgi:hypothetical protein
MPGGNTQTDDPKPGTFTGGRSTRSVLLARETKGTEQSRGSGIRIYEKGQIHCICMDENSMMLRSSSTLFFFGPNQYYSKTIGQHFFKVEGNIRK